MSLLRATVIGAVLVSVATGSHGARSSGAQQPVLPRPVLGTPAPVVEPPSPDPSLPAPANKLNPDPVHPTGNLIEISIANQRLAAWKDGAVVFRFVISTGRAGYETPAGRYKILEKYENRWSRKWSVWMPFAMRWHQGYFIHQLPHKDGSSHNIGASKLGTPDSHGCVRVDVGDAERLFRWTKIGTPVWVH